MQPSGPRLELHIAIYKQHSKKFWGIVKVQKYFMPRGFATCETQNRAQEKSPDRAMANIQCVCTRNNIRLKKKKRVLTGPLPTLVPPLSATEAVGWGQCHSIHIRSTMPKSSDTKANLIYKRAFCNYFFFDQIGQFISAKGHSGPSSM